MGRMRGITGQAAAAAIIAASASPVGAQAISVAPQASIAPMSERLTLLGVFSNATLVVQGVMAGLIVATVVSAFLWAGPFVRRGRSRNPTLPKNAVWLSAVAAAAPRIGVFGAAYTLLNGFIGIANVRPLPSLTVLAPGLAEATLSIGLGLLASAIAIMGHRHLTHQQSDAMADAETSARAPRINARDMLGSL